MWTRRASISTSSTQGSRRRRSSGRSLLSERLDAERVIILDQGAYQAHAGVLVAQALHHGNAHREQICPILTGAGLQPPDVQAWAYADATGRGGERNPTPED